MNPHYSPYQDRYGLWVFTSPLGKHGPFWTKLVAEQAVLQVGRTHLDRSQRDGAEAALLRKYFTEQTPA